MTGPTAPPGDARPTVSVVVVAYGSEPWLERCMASALGSRDVDVEVVLVDNGCTDDTVDRIEAQGGVTVVRPGRNLGFASGCNLGARHATGQVLVLLNQDAVLEPGALAALAAVACRPDVGVATASVRLGSDPRLLNSSGNPVHFLGFAWSGGFEEPASRYDEERDVTAASGAGMAVRRPVWDRLGGFADEYFAYHEDVELSLRCWQQGLRVVYVPTAVVTHRYEFSRNRRKYHLLERNRLILVLTLTEPRTLALLAPALLAMEAAMLVVAAGGGWLPDKVAGWTWLLRNRHWVAARRRLLQAERTVPAGLLNRRLATRFDAGALLPLPEWCRPFDRALAGYWALVLWLLRIRGHPPQAS